MGVGKGMGRTSFNTLLQPEELQALAFERIAHECSPHLRHLKYDSLLGFREPLVLDPLF